jgi:hypothetical protein
MATDVASLSRAAASADTTSGIKFDDFGTHTLKGIREQWQVYRAIS